MNNGKFVISLDFELHWGFFDHRSLADSKSQLLNMQIVIDKLLDMSKQHNTCITFATVGFLFAQDKDDSLKFSPEQKPYYKNRKLDAYTLLNNIAEHDSKFYFAKSLVSKIQNSPLHEICTHTFSHYYCYEAGQTIEDFKEDLASAIKIANNLNIKVKSIVFPRNQVVQNYVKLCEDMGIETYRGNCSFNFFNSAKGPQLKEYGLMILRIVDSYFNISGSNSFNLDEYNHKESKLINIPASRFLRPYHHRLRILEKLKIKRIKYGMTQAAIRNEVYHLWWHPHNFANNIDENFKNLSDILQHYTKLNNTYNFESITMENLGKKYKTDFLN